MGKGKRGNVLSAFIVLAMLPEILGWVAPKFCHDYNCPEFTVVDKNAVFEERMYNESQWMTVHIKSTRIFDITRGFDKLVDYCNRKNIEGSKVDAKTWPVLVRQGTADGNHSVSISWFFAPATELPTALDTAIVKEVRPAGIVYVRSFKGIATVRKAFRNLAKLRKGLTKAGKDFEGRMNMGLIYNLPWDIVYPHYSEVWLDDAPQDQDSKY